MENLLTTAVLLPLVGAFLLFLFPANALWRVTLRRDRVGASDATERVPPFEKFLLAAISQFILKGKEVN